MLLGDTVQANEPAPLTPSGDGDSGEKDVDQSTKAFVKRWTDRIRKAKSKWKDDFDRMRDNMDFVNGLQWAGQKKIKYSKYIANITLRAVNQGVATLYARNPQVSAKRRPRLDFQLWDGKMETIMQMIMTAQLMQQSGVPVPPEVLATLDDFQKGRFRQQMIERVGKTLEIVYQYQMDSQQPRFKTQMKQLVRRVRVCGVGYMKVLFCREAADFSEEYLTQSTTKVSLANRMRLAAAIVDKLQKDEIQEDDAEVEQLKQLIASLNQSPLDYPSAAVTERLVFDFPKATSIIPDPDTRSLKGFVGAHWVVEEFYYPLDFVNAFFGTTIKAGGDVKTFPFGEKQDDGVLQSGEKQDTLKKKVRLWEVYDLDTKSEFLLCDGYKDFVVAPQPVDPSTKGFWCIFPFSFNDTEVEEGCEATIFPPSDVDLLRPVQQERNRARDSLRRHRKANAPRYVYPKGALSEEDLDKIEESEDQQYIGLSGLNPSQEPGKVLQALQTVDIKPELYDVEPLNEDALLVSGQQEANLGPAQPNVTATVGTIAEQSRMSVASSDVDGLDDGLTDVAQCGGELLLKEMSVETVKRIAGIGAVWPQESLDEFINEIELEVQAASSGKPNKVVDMNNWNIAAPLILQASQLPPQAQPTIQAVIRETLKRTDDRLEPADFYPLPMPMGGEGQPEEQQGGQQTPSNSAAPPPKRTPKKKPQANAGMLPQSPQQPQEY